MDIVERLRAPENIVNRDRADAADEIERLRDALQIIVNCDPSDFEVTDIVEFARSVLQQKEND